jgi:hypothetical protein
MLLNKYTRVVNGLAETKKVYEALAQSLDVDLVRLWKEQVALEERGDTLRIYEVKSVKGRCKNHCSHPVLADLPFQLPLRQRSASTLSTTTMTIYLMALSHGCVQE